MDWIQILDGISLTPETFQRIAIIIEVIPENYYVSVSPFLGSNEM